jgi:hypothetical protein
LLHLALTDRRLVAFVLVQALDHFLVRARCRLGSIAGRRLLSPTGATRYDKQNKETDGPRSQFRHGAPAQAYVSHRH